MTTKILSIATIATLCLNSCGNHESENKKTEETTVVTPLASSETDVPFKIAERYFLNQPFTETQLSNPKITSKDEFDKLFGMATVMGKDGKPTDIDFTKEYVIAVTENETDLATSITPVSVKEKDKKITFKYEVKQGEKTSSTSKPLLMLIVDNKYNGELVIEKSIVK